MSLSFKFISLKTKTQYGKPLTITLRYKQSAGVCDMRDEKKRIKLTFLMLVNSMFYAE